MSVFVFRAAALLLMIVCGLLAWTTAAVARQSARDEASPADAIVILGAAEYLGRPSPVLRARLDHGLDLWRRGLAPILLTTGGAGENSRFTEAEAARDYLVQHGVAAESILMETEGGSTLQSTAAAGEILRRMNLRRCIVVSDGYHVFRAKRMLERSGVVAYGSPRQGPSEGLRHTWLCFRQAAGYWIWTVGLAR
jgi:uncharacterized SAM-binding protein YcdF (DUF218 family)